MGYNKSSIFVITKTIKTKNVMGHKLKSNVKSSTVMNTTNDDKLISKEKFKSLFSKEVLKPMSIEQINDARLNAYSPIF